MNKGGEVQVGGSIEGELIVDDLVRSFGLCALTNAMFTREPLLTEQEISHLCRQPILRYRRGAIACAVRTLESVPVGRVQAVAVTVDWRVVLDLRVRVRNDASRE